MRKLVDTALLAGTVQMLGILSWESTMLWAIASSIRTPVSIDCSSGSSCRSARPWLLLHFQRLNIMNAAPAKHRTKTATTPATRIASATSSSALPLEMPSPSEPSATIPTSFVVVDSVVVAEVVGVDD